MLKYIVLPLVLLEIITISCTAVNHNSITSKKWKLVWADEFSGDQLNLENWAFDLGTGAGELGGFKDFNPDFRPGNIPADDFSVRWEGTVTAKSDGKTTFFLLSDDGSRLWLNDELLINQWHAQAATEKSAEIFLHAGEKYDIRVEYFEAGGMEACILSWSGDGYEKEIIPAKIFHSEGQEGLRGTYCSSKNPDELAQPVVIRQDAQINFVASNGWGNNESQYYTDRPKNVRVSDGKLIIEALKERYRGADYTSSRIKTKASWKYGRFETRAKLPQGVGTWAAFWALPTDRAYGPWPDSGEIDILEHVGYSEGNIYAGVHTGHLAGNLYKSDQQKWINTADVCENFHNYWLEWDAERIVVGMDEESYFEFSKNGRGTDYWPFDQRFHLLMNIAIGGNWGGIEGIDDSIFPTKMEIDWVRIFEKNR